MNVNDFEFLFGSVTDMISLGMRGMLIARDGKKFVGGDLAQMEARVLAWLVDDQNKLDMYRNGIDVYSVLASDIYGYPVTKKMLERQVGKVADLSLGYGGGIDAFVGMSKGYGLDLTPIAPVLWQSATATERENAVKSDDRYRTKAEEPIPRPCALAADIIKQRWRAKHPKEVTFWSDLERAIAQAIVSKEAVHLGKLKFFVHDKFLFIRLPSSKCIAYFKPIARARHSGGFDVSYVNARYGRVTHWGGQWCENVVQATQRELLVDCMFRLEDAGYEIVYHNYDETASEVDSDVDCLQEYTEIMKVCPAWAEGLPINTEGWEGKRYGK